VSLAQDLAEGLQKLGIAVPPSGQERLIRYLGLIEKWNKVHNLTAIRDPEQMLSHHLLDSLAVLPHLGAAKTLLDVGSGAGLPGIPLGIVRPDLEITLLDSSHKRYSFQQQSKAELSLDNVTAIHSRVEEYRNEIGFDVVVSRAFSDLDEFVQAARHLCAKGGRLLAMKGLFPYEEIAKLPAGTSASEVVELTVPGLDANRHLVSIAVN
jgi:16S rRNA (guanine527-N7)-methyltransferase